MNRPDTPQRCAEHAAGHRPERPLSRRIVDFLRVGPGQVPETSDATTSSYPSLRCNMQSYRRHLVRIDLMMKFSRRLWLLACGTLLAGWTTGNVCHAQPPSQYPGGLPWDMRQQYYEQIPSNRASEGRIESPLDRFLGQAVDQTWLRFDYVHWDLESPTNQAIGADVLNVPRPDEGYTIADSTTGLPSVDVDSNEQRAFTPRLGEIDLNSLNGARLTWGLETNYGTLEASVLWILQDTRGFDFGAPFAYRSTQTFREPLDGVVALPFSVNGNPATQAIVGDRMIVNYDTELFNTEINFITEDHRPNNGFRFQYLFGARYLRLTDGMRIAVVNSPVPAIGNTPAVPGTDANFESSAQNQVWGPQIGARIELQDEVFTLGAKPAFVMGFNHMNARTTGNNPSNPFDDTLPLIENSDTNNLIAPMFSLQLYTQIRLWENVKLFGAYDLLYLDSVSRAYDTIVYDTSTATQLQPASPGFGASTKHTHMFNQGFSVGLLIEF